MPSCRQWAQRTSRQWPVAVSLSRAPLRSFASSSTDPSPNIHLSTRNSAIVIPASVAGASPDHLIRAIQLPDRRYFPKDRVAVIFLTPAFAPWLRDDQTFVRKAVRHVFKNVFDGTIAAPQTTVSAIVAVVQKLPTPEPIEDVGTIRQEAIYRMRTPPVSDTGHEGMAYTTMYISDLQYRARTGIDEMGSISFLTSARSKLGVLYSDSLRLPLANTIFQTGSTTTMLLSKWQKKEDSQDLELISTTDLSELVLELRRNTSVEQRSALAIPLIPLTHPRTVDAAMGNILRRVIGPDEKSVTASEELERAVHEYFKSRSEPPQGVSVWALVIPKEALESVVRATDRLLAYVRQQSGIDDASSASAPWARLWNSQPPEWNDFVTLALSRGARLHRVLSGGGGWGKKAGLLSLDPSAIGEELGIGHEHDFSGLEPADLSSALGQVVRPEDSIQFFVSPSASAREATSNNTVRRNIAKLKKLSGLRTPWMWELGTVPSTTDDLQTSSWQHNTPKSDVTFVFRNVFGALAEGGVTIKREVKPDGQESLGVLKATKVDVPFSRFSSVNLTDQDGEESNLAERKQKFPQTRFFRSDTALTENVFGAVAPSLLALPRPKAMKDEREVPVPQLDDQTYKMRKVLAYNTAASGRTTNVGSQRIKTLRYQLIKERIVGDRHLDSRERKRLIQFYLLSRKLRMKRDPVDSEEWVKMNKPLVKRVKVNEPLVKWVKVNERSAKEVKMNEWLVRRVPVKRETPMRKSAKIRTARLTSSSKKRLAKKELLVAVTSWLG